MKIYLTYRERAAGIFLLAGVALVVAFVVGAAIQNRWFKSQIGFHAQVTRGEGLRSGSPVLLSGIEVGQVGEISIMPDNRVDVEILVDEENAHRVRAGTRAVVRRLLGIGEKRVDLVASASGEPLPPGALIPADEPVDLLDAISSVNLGNYIRTMDRMVSAMEVMLSKLEEENRLERMVVAFDHLGPTMEKMNALLDDIEEPLSALLADPSLRRTFQGADRVFNDPATRGALRGVATTLEPGRMDQIMKRMDRLVARLDDLMAGGHLEGTLAGADRLLNDGRMDRMLTSVERLSDADKLGRLVDNMGALADQMARIGPEIPTLTREMLATMREVVITLKALQKTWLLESESEEVRKELKGKEKPK